MDGCSATPCEVHKGDTAQSVACAAGILQQSLDLVDAQIDPAASNEVMRIPAGGYFGEKSLLESDPRAADMPQVSYFM